MNNTKERRLGAKIAFALLSLLLFSASCVAALFFFGERGLFGYGARLMLSSSMAEEPAACPEEEFRTIPLGSLIVIRLVPNETAAREAFFAEIETGDVLTFRYQTVGGAVTITHRVKAIEPSGDGYHIELGANGEHAGTQTINTGDPQSGNFILGKVVFCSLPLGVLLGTMRDPLFLAMFGLVILLTLLSALQKRRAANRARLPLRRGKHEK